MPSSHHDHVSALIADDIMNQIQPGTGASVRNMGHRSNVVNDTDGMFDKMKQTIKEGKAALNQENYAKGKEWGRKQLKKVTGSEMGDGYGDPRGYDGTTRPYRGKDRHHMDELENISRRLDDISCDGCHDPMDTHNAHVRSSDPRMYRNDSAHARSRSHAPPCTVDNSYRASYCNAPFLGACASSVELPYNIPHETNECCQDKCRQCMVERRSPAKRPAIDYSSRPDRRAYSSADTCAFSSPDRQAYSSPDRQAYSSPDGRAYSSGTYMRSRGHASARHFEREGNKSNWSASDRETEWDDRQHDFDYRSHNAQGLHHQKHHDTAWIQPSAWEKHHHSPVADDARVKYPEGRDAKIPQGDWRYR